MTFFSFLELLFIGPLKFIFELIFSMANVVIGHPGLAIIALSLVMNILVLPLYRRADAMQEEARDMDAKLKDGVEHIKKTFSGDERMMILQTYYRQNNYSPLSALNGSVSLLLEIPFFMAAYQFLSHVTALNGVAFGPIADLGAPDGLLVIGGLTLNVLPILMTLINVVSSAIYLKGFPLKTKVQLYGIAAFFLVFLYESPSALVFYWTLNNVFSLIKNIFYKLKNPRKILTILCSLAGIALIVFSVTKIGFAFPKRLVILCAMGVLLQLPVAAMLLASRVPLRLAPAHPNRKLYLLSCLFLTILVGAYIPSSYIAASPQEYVDPSLFLHPLWHVAYTITLGAGLFLVWMQVFYWLANDTGKSIMEKAVLALCGVMLVNYMFFGTDLGSISATLQYGLTPEHTLTQQIGNITVILIVAATLWTLAVKRPSIAVSGLLVAALAMGSMSGVNTVKISSALNQDAAIRIAQEAAPKYDLSKHGKNVIVLFLDRAISAYVPYMMNESPELLAQFDGFTYYPNTLAYSACTNMASPALFGGYEYTPIELNKRGEEALVDKHNEALKVLPVIFDEQGYQVTICDPCYAGYDWNADLTIYDDYPNIDAYITEGKFDSDAQKRFSFENTHRNFFCFSLMKCIPLCLQSILYNNGSYLQSAFSDNEETYLNQAVTGISTATGVKASFMRSYNVLDNLDNMVNIKDSEENTFLSLTNNATHEAVLLQTPDYVPAQIIDNTQYDSEHADRFTVNGETIRMDNVKQYTHYHANMGVFKALGRWFDILRQEGVYDNTRIILVSDHGYALNLTDKMLLPTDNGTIDLDSYTALLMVKDFNSTGFTTTETFMTNADVATLATHGVIDNPRNPFTGNPINSAEKTRHDQMVIQLVGNAWRLEDNNGNTFLPAPWLQVKDDIRDHNNWTYLPEVLVRSEY